MPRVSVILLPIALAALFGCGPARVHLAAGIAPQPICPYGYFDVEPYACAPYGYYGPEWFNNGAFIGAGPWFHGPTHFRGCVDNHFHPDHGYRGPMPVRGAAPARRITGAEFHGNEMRDGRGHVVRR
jgi:hypothetical protein